MNIWRSDLERAWNEVAARFPFPDYLEEFQMDQTCFEVAETVSRYVPVGSRILDFGAGPVDKTALVATLGYNCTAMDDLDDEWHKRGDARQSILDFAADMGIRYIPLDGNGIPPAGEFDMVMLHSVLQHLRDSPRYVLVNLVERLRIGGYLFITVPNHVNLRKRLAMLRGKSSHIDYRLYYWYPDRWRGPVREYTRYDCIELIEALGLELAEIRGVHEMLFRLPPSLRRPYVAVSKLMPSTRDTWLIVARKPAGWVPKLELDDEEFRRVSGLTSWGEGPGPRLSDSV